MIHWYYGSKKRLTQVSCYDKTSTTKYNDRMMGGYNLTTRRRRKNVVKYRKSLQINIGGIAFLVIFVYLLFSCIIYFRKPRISVYEVIEKEISDNYSCTGMILREEQIVNTKQSGYLNYYYGDGAKVSKNSTVYTIDETGEIYDLLKSTNSENSLQKDERKRLWDVISNFRKEYDESKYQTVTDFGYNIENTVLELSNSSMAKTVEEILESDSAGKDYKKVPVKKSGIISYSMDGYEDLKESDITSDMFREKDYEKKQLRTSEKVESGAPAYKLITSEDWSVVLNLSEEMYNTLNEKEKEALKKGNSKAYITVTFVKENITVTVPYQTFTKKDGYFLSLSLSDYVIHFIDERFVEVELELNSAEGLKIPVTSILEKEFYTVPSEYFTEGGDSGKTGLIKEVYDKSGDVSYTFVEANKYYQTEDGTVYVDKDLFEDGEWIRNQENQERYQIGAKGDLKGVYNVNYGYCLFKRIEILYENEEYCIVDDSTANGLSPFDHIIVDATTVTEDDLINKYKSE